MHPDRQIVHHTDRHAGCLRHRLRAFDLLIADPLQPHVELHAHRELVAQLGDERRVDVGRLGGPVGTGVVLFEGAPQGEVLQRLPLARAERGELGRAAR